MSKKEAALTDDQRFAEWAKRIKVVSDETSSLFWNRKLFKVVMALVAANPKLQSEGGFVWDWIAGMYGRDVAMGVRRELDEQSRVLNLYHLLHEIERHPHVLTRARYHAFFAYLPLMPGAEIDAQWERFGGPPGPGDLTDHVAAEVVAHDRKQLQADVRPVFDNAQRLVAHRTPVGEVPLTFRQLHDAMGAIFRCLRKYHVLLTGTSIASATPFPSFSVVAPFRSAWWTPEFKAPEDDD